MPGATGTWEAPADEQQAPEWHSLSSSNLSSYRYDPKTETLQISFKSGKTYIYADVPKSVADGLGTASSPGSYFHASIKNQFSYK